MNGRKALITGGSRGLGRALSHKLALEGVNVTLLARNSDDLQQVVKQLPRKSHQNHSYLALDLLNTSQLTQLNSKHTQDVSILVNCAGMTNYSLLTKTSPEEICNTINLNLLVPILLSRIVGKSMLKFKSPQFRPAILNISSVLSLPEYQLPGTSVYAALKAGLNGFTKSLSGEFRDRIRVNSVLPGLIRETDMGSSIVHENIEPVSIEAVLDKCVEIIKDDSLNGECITIT